jgi:hypothetical protein
MSEKNLTQRVVEAKKLINVAITGQNQYKKPAISIEDVEEAILGPMTEVGIATYWSCKEIQSINNSLWQGTWQVRLENADNREDCYVGEMIDIGSTPAAAFSFARKAFYKSLFHLTGGNEEGKPRQEQEKPSKTTDKSVSSQPQSLWPEVKTTLDEYAVATGMNVGTIVARIKDKYKIPDASLISDLNAPVQQKILDDLKRGIENAKKVPA